LIFGGEKKARELLRPGARFISLGKRGKDSRGTVQGEKNGSKPPFYFFDLRQRGLLARLSGSEKKKREPAVGEPSTSG